MKFPPGHFKEKFSKKPQPKQPKNPNPSGLGLSLEQTANAVKKDPPHIATEPSSFLHSLGLNIPVRPSLPFQGPVPSTSKAFPIKLILLYK